MEREGLPNIYAKKKRVQLIKICSTLETKLIMDKLEELRLSDTSKLSL